jgi:predicted DNA-binding ribbon-helix-helix protein
MSGVIKRSVTIAGHRTSVSLEEEFWSELQGMARSRSVSMNTLIADIDARRGRYNLSSALRIAVLDHLKVGGQKSDRNHTVG